jgi:hypothetical protein
MVSVFTSSVGDCGLISTVLLCRLWVDIYGFIVKYVNIVDRYISWKVNVYLVYT